MSDISEAALAKRNEELSGEVSSLKAENRDRRLRNKTATTELETLRAQVLTLTTERDGFQKTATAAPAEKDVEIASLKGKLLAREHRDAFSSVKDFDGDVDVKTGKAPKLRLGDSVSIDTIFKLTDYKAEGATPDAKTVATKLGEAAKAYPGLFTAVDPAADAATQRITIAAREGGPGAAKTTSATLLAASGGSAVNQPKQPVEGRI